MKVKLLDIQEEQKPEIADLKTMEDLIRIIKAKLEGKEEIMTIFINLKKNEVELIY